MQLYSAQDCMDQDQKITNWGKPKYHILDKKKRYLAKAKITSSDSLKNRVYVAYFNIESLTLT